MDVPLGDRALRVPGLELDVRLRVPRRRLVGERRVAEVMEGAERLRDPGALERGAQVAACELGGVERRPARRVAEDELVVALVAPSACQCSCEYARASRGPSSIVRRAVRLLGSRELAADERLAHLQRAVEELDVAPAEREQLAAAEGRPERDERRACGRAATRAARSASASSLELARRPSRARAISTSVRTCISGCVDPGGLDVDDGVALRRAASAARP